MNNEWRMVVGVGVVMMRRMGAFAQEAAVKALYGKEFEVGGLVRDFPPVWKDGNKQVVWEESQRGEADVGVVRVARWGEMELPGAVGEAGMKVEGLVFHAGDKEGAAQFQEARRVVDEVLKQGEATEGVIARLEKRGFRWGVSDGN